MIRHGNSFSEKRVSTGNNTICFESGYTIKYFYFYLFLGFIGLLIWSCMFFFIIYGSRNNSVTLIVFWLLSFCYAMHISLTPIKEMLFRNRICIKFSENEIVITNIFGKKRKRYFSKKNNIKFKHKIYFYYKLFYYKIILESEDVNITVLDHISKRKEALSLCDFLQNFNNNVEG
jgi:hypothetical protein